MNNATIIFLEQMDLLEQGKIKSTGKEISFEREDGTQAIVPEPEPIHTYSAWMQLGYKVKSGEKAIACFKIWKWKGKDNDKPFLQNAFFFAEHQVEPIS